MQRSLTLEICQVRVSALAQQELYEVCNFVCREINACHMQQSQPFVVSAVDINAFVLQQLAHDAGVVLEHRDGDGRHFPRVVGVEVRSILDEKVDALQPAVARCVVDRVVLRRVGLVPVGAVLQQKRGNFDMAVLASHDEGRAFEFILGQHCRHMVLAELTVP